MEGVPSADQVASPSPAQAAPARDIVILRESDLTEDLGRAIQRVRADQETAHSQILIIAPDAEFGSNELLPRPASPAARAREAAVHDALARWAGELAPLVADLEQFLVESDREIAGLAEEIAEGTRARLQHRSRVLGEIGTWMRAVAGDLREATTAAQLGWRAAELGELVAEAVADLGREGCHVAFVVVPAPAVTVTTDPCRAADLIAGVARLVAARIGRQGRVEVSVERRPGGARVEFRGQGAPVRVRAPALVARVRELASALGVTLVAGAGPGSGTSIELVLPAVPPRP